MDLVSDIESRRTRITPFRQSQITNRYVNWLNDPEIVRYSEQRHSKHTMDSCQAFFSSFKDTDNSFLAIEVPEFGHIGNIVVTRNIANLRADMSILIGETNTRGLGYGAEAWGAVLEYLLITEKLRKVTAGTMSINKPMLSVMEKTGMRIEGRLERQFLFDGQEVDLVVAAAIRDTWAGTLPETMTA